MSQRRSYFEQQANALADCAVLDVVKSDGATRCFLRPLRMGAASVVLYLGVGDQGTVGLDDQACAPAELGGNIDEDMRAIDQTLRLAVEGRALAFHLGRGGCVEEINGLSTTRTWCNAWPWPGWRRRAERVTYLSYR
jgi:hypothetical protein